MVLLTAEQLRRRNLEQIWIKLSMPIDRLGRAAGLNRGRLRQLIGKKAYKNIGSVVARKMEKNLDMPHGWLDQNHPEKELRERADFVRFVMFGHQLKKLNMLRMVSANMPERPDAAMMSLFRGLVPATKEKKRVRK